MEWIQDQNPNKPGIYPVIIMYDVQEGGFPNASVWDGREWENRAVIAYLDKVFESQDEAYNYAYQHDPNW